jgi:hypothetical protein
MHVGDPTAVIAEAVRCVRPNGVLTIFEPDWSTLAVNGSPVPTQWISIATHPSVGAVVGELLTAAGCAIRDRVEERSMRPVPVIRRCFGKGQTDLRSASEQFGLHGDIFDPSVRASHRPHPDPQVT